MASLWQKTLFYLGLVDDDQIEEAEQAVAQASEPQAQVRTVEPHRAPTATPVPTSASAAAGRSSSTVAGRRIEPPESARRRISVNPQHAEAGVLLHEPGDGPGTPAPGESEIIEARTFSDAQQLADFIRQGHPVVLDLRSTEPAMVRRLVDFSTGLTYALDGRMAKIAQGVILVTPHHTVIGVEEQRRLSELGLYQAPAGG